MVDIYCSFCKGLTWAQGFHWAYCPRCKRTTDKPPDRLVTTLSIYLMGRWKSGYFPPQIMYSQDLSNVHGYLIIPEPFSYTESQEEEMECDG